MTIRKTSATRPCAPVSARDGALSVCQHSTGRIGRVVQHVLDTGSTNDIALEAGRNGAAEGFVAVAEAQTAGRGRLGRQWHAPTGSSLLFSILFRPPEPLAYHASRVTMVCGLGLIEAVRKVSGASVWLKWPNDLIVMPTDDARDWHKLAGMLTEVEPASSEVPAFVVVGIGLNVNVPEGSLAHLGPNATSLLALTGQKIDRAQVLDRLLEAVDRGYTALLSGTDPLPVWRATLAWLGSTVEVVRSTERLVGVAAGVDDDGALLLRSLDGKMLRITAGDVSLRPSS